VLIRRTSVVCALLACVVPAAWVSQAGAAKSHKKTMHRVGGHVHHAWPIRGKAPKGALARWLARQVGPTSVKPCRIPGAWPLLAEHKPTVALFPSFG
jgi:hypothetical protein